jgi:uncharacterized protein YoaH (UPF0181 family)
MKTNVEKVQDLFDQGPIIAPPVYNKIQCIAIAMVADEIRDLSKTIDGLNKTIDTVGMRIKAAIDNAG